MGRLDEFEAHWQREAQAIVVGMKEWRLQHPRATFREIETALDERLNALRARLLQDLALASAAADLRQQAAGERPRCAECGAPLEPRGQHARTVVTQGDQAVRLERSYAVCPACGAGLFPLDEELQLLPGALSPWLHEALVHLGTWLPFEQAARELAFFGRVAVSEATATRLTEAAGAAWVALQTAEVERLEREQPDGPPGPALQQVSADGAMVPLVGGEWAEVKTVAIGTVETTVGPEGRPEVHTRDLSYFSRLADAETFTHLALAELHRRGTATAGTVVAPMDGADWEQTFLDTHRPDAVRILDFPHALGHLSAAAQATFGAGTAETSAWLEAQAHTLTHGHPDEVLGALRALPTEQSTDPAAAAEARDATLGSLEKRRGQIEYARFQTLGYPIGSGSIESANKLVVEVRLKGAGMHWARAHVDPMLALRTIACADRWAEAWPQIAAALRQLARQRTSARRHARQPAPTSPPAPAKPTPPPPVLRPSDLEPTHAPAIVNGRPTADHPWKKRPLLARGRARAKS